MSQLDRRTGALPHLFATAAPSPHGAPLLPFLHGARDRGTHLDLLLCWAPPRRAAEANAPLPRPRPAGRLAESGQARVGLGRHP